MTTPHFDCNDQGYGVKTPALNEEPKTRILP